MPFSSLQLCFLFLFSTIFLIKWLFSTRKRSMILPPSPQGLPIVGNIHQLGSTPHHSLQSLAQKHGPVILIHLGRVPILVVSSADAAREIMKTHDRISANRPHSKIIDKLLYGSKDLSFSAYGEYWRQLKTLSVLHLLSTKKVNSYKHVREEEVAVMVENLTIISSGSSSSVVNLSEIYTSVPNNVVCRVVTGRKYGEGVNGMKFKELLLEFVELLGVFKVGDYIPWLSFVDRFTGLNARLDRVANGLDQVLEYIISDHTEKKDGDRCDDEQDFIDILLGLEKDNTTQSPIQRESVKALVLDMFSAGTDTTYTVLEWATAELLRNPKIMKKLQNEIKEIADNKSRITEEDKDKMEYLKMVIKETLRLHPPVPLLLPRELSADIKVNGYDIPARTQVIINAWAIGRDASFWEDPEEFKPERFLNNSIDYKGLNFEFIPFGAGRRGCPGILFGVTLAELALANLLHKFDIALHQLGSILHRSLHSLAEKHGAIILLHFGRVPVLVVSSSDAAQEIMKTHDLLTATRPHSRIFDALLYNSKDITFSTYGEHWRQVKSIAVLHLRSHEIPFACYCNSIFLLADSCSTNLYTYLLMSRENKSITPTLLGSYCSLLIYSPAFFLFYCLSHAQHMPIETSIIALL